MDSYNILKVFQGSYNQGHLKYNETAGKQCVCNALMSIVWTKIRKVSLWRKIDLDLILDRGDLFILRSRIIIIISENYEN